MKNLELNQMEDIQGGGPFADFLAGVACGGGLVLAAGTGGAALGLAYIGCAAAFATVADL